MMMRRQSLLMKLVQSYLLGTGLVPYVAQTSLAIEVDERCPGWAEFDYPEFNRACRDAACRLLASKRVRLVRHTDPYATLEPGVLGSIVAMSALE